MFSFGGLELIGITAAEAQNPEKSIPKAVNQVVYRILLFYIGSLVVLLALYPWVEIKSDSSPFVMIFHNLDSNLVASALNFVILVASLSVYNSGVYSNSRMLFGLSVQGNAPKFLARVSKRGVPVNSLLLSGIITSLVVVLNYLLPHEALGLLMALVVATLLLNWIMICMAHLKFRAAQRRKGRESKFKALLAPASNYFCIAFLGLILALMCTIDGMRLSAILLLRCGSCSCLSPSNCCAARRKRDAPPSGGAACFFIVILFAGGAFAWRTSFCNRLLLF